MSYLSDYYDSNNVEEQNFEFKKVLNKNEDSDVIVRSIQNKPASSLFVEKIALRYSLPMCGRKVLWSNLFNDVATSIHHDKIKQLELESVMSDGLFYPAGRTISSARGGSFVRIIPNCAVLSVNELGFKDRFAKIYQKGTGLGINLNSLGKGEACQLFSELAFFCEGVEHSDGRVHGNVVYISISHPDVARILTLKRELDINTFGVNIGISNDEMCKIISNDGKLSIIFDSIVSNVHKRGDPGLVFIDNVIEHIFPRIVELSPNTTIEDLRDKIASVPCSEQFLLPNETCNLGAINIAMHVRDDKLDYGLLERTARIGAECLLAVKDKIDFDVKPQFVRVGLGFFGLASCFKKLGLTYGSLDSLQIASNVAKIIGDVSRKTCGNCCATASCVPPTGGISELASYHCRFPFSKGIEPDFLEAIQISPADHIAMQSVVQKHLCQSIAKTVNVTSSTTMKEISDLFVEAWKKRVHGICVYRDQSRNQQPICLLCN